jgi:tetratricopeptide (TPR) repeat protein
LALDTFQIGDREAGERGIIKPGPQSGWRYVGDRAGEGTTFNNLGYLAESLGQADAARRYYELALAIFQEIGAVDSARVVANNLAYLDNFAAVTSASDEAPDTLPAATQETIPPPPQRSSPTRQPRPFWPILAFATLTLLNLAILLLALQHPAQPSDPLIFQVAARNALLVVAVALAIPALVVINTLIAYQSPRLRGAVRAQLLICCLVLLAILASYAL